MTYGEVGSGAVLVLERHDGSISTATISRKYIPAKFMSNSSSGGGQDSREGTPRSGNGSASGNHSPSFFNGTNDPKRQKQRGDAEVRHRRPVLGVVRRF